MDVYAGHSALDPAGVKLTVKNDTLVLRPVYCLIDPPVTLCRPDVLITQPENIEGSSYLKAKIEIPDTPKRVVLKFRYGDNLELKEIR